MSQPFRDVSRGRKLTKEEVARNEKARNQVMTEVPPARGNVVIEAISKLRLLREELGLSLAEMEQRTGMTRANLCRLENESRNVQVRTLERYARALGCKVGINVVSLTAPVDHEK